MRESNEGVVRLQMLTELCLRDILEFIYTGNVQISAEDNAQDLIQMADHLVLPHLKTLAESCLVGNLKLNDLNCISTYYFAEKYSCEDLICVSKNFILANFTTVAKTEDFLNLSNKEVKMWISRDEINVSAEEDVFTLILTWIDRAKLERKKFFGELFRAVRLAFVSRDYLFNDIMANDLVNDNEDFMDLVKDAVKYIDATNYHHLRVKPRNSLNSPIMVFRFSLLRDQIVACYYPREDSWSWFYGPEVPCNDGKVISCHGDLHFIPDISHYGDEGPFRCDSCSNRFEKVPYAKQRFIRKVLATNEEEIYVLSVSELNGRTCSSELDCWLEGEHKEHVYFITKYKPESNSWEDITSFNMGSRIHVCVVAKDNYIYFLGGSTQSGDRQKIPTDADRYDLSTNTWEKIADLHKQRCNVDSFSAVRNGEILLLANRWTEMLLKFTTKEQTNGTFYNYPLPLHLTSQDGWLSTADFL